MSSPVQRSPQGEAHPGSAGLPPIEGTPRSRGGSSGERHVARLKVRRELRNDPCNTAQLNSIEDMGQGQISL